MNPDDSNVTGSQGSATDYLSHSFTYMLSAGALVLLLPVLFAVVVGLAQLAIYVLIWPYSGFLHAQIARLLEAQREVAASARENADFFWSLWAQGLLFLAVYAAVGWPLRRLARYAVAKLRLRRVVARLMRVEAHQDLPPALLDIIRRERIGQRLDYEERGKLPPNEELWRALAEDESSDEEEPPAGRHAASGHPLLGDGRRILTFSWGTFLLVTAAVIVGSAVAPGVRGLLRELGELVVAGVMASAAAVPVSRAAVALAQLTAVVEGVSRWWPDRRPIP